MTTPSPLGQYAPIIASLVAAAVVAGYIISALTANQAGQNALHDALLLALGAVFGGAAAVPAINGHVQSQVNANAKRLDAMGAPPAGSLPDNPPH